MKRNEKKIINIQYPNYYPDGGIVLNPFNFKDTFTKDNLINMGVGLVNGLSGTLSKGINSAISGGLNSGIGNSINSIGNTAGDVIGAVNPLLGSVVKLGSGIIGGGMNALFGSKLNNETINKIEDQNKALNTIRANTDSFDALQNQISTQDFGMNFTKSDIGKDSLFSNKASKEFRRLKNEQEIAQARGLQAYADAATNIDKNNDMNIMANYAAYGGSFNGYKDGGSLSTQGTEWSNGVTTINNGGKHEENIYEGVPIGIDVQGTPNLVEEGEVIWEDYVFSNRIKVPKSIRNKYKLKGNKDMTFADAVKKASKESEERPNDPISKKGLEDTLSKLQYEQESIRQKKMLVNRKNKYNNGGTKVNKFDGESTNSMNLIYPSFIPEPDKPYTIPTIFNFKGTNSNNFKSSDLKGVQIVPKYVKDDNNKNNNNWETKLRYAPIVGSALGVAQNLLSKPDYSNADRLEEISEDVGNYIPVSYDTISNYLEYKPFDRNFYLNKLEAQSGATRRSIMNSINPSRNAALLAADYNAQTQLGDLARRAEEYNLAQRQSVEQFNRDTNKFNSEMGLKAAMANQEMALRAKSGKLSGISQAMALRNAIDDRRNTSYSANLTNLFNNLGNLGIDAYNRADRDMLLRSGVLGTLSEKPQDWTDKQWDKYRLDILNSYNKSNSKNIEAKGGKLNRRKGGFTY